MGLDNIPGQYPCKKNNTAVMDEDNRIDCQATINAGMCPYHTIKKNDPLVKDIGGVLGIFGADCWYRGKYGNYLLAELARWNEKFDEEMEDGTFYGDIQEDDDTQGGISEDECIRMSEIMSKYSESWSDYVNNSGKYVTAEEKKNAINDWIYAAWWLKFVGENADGSAVWY